MKSNKESPDWRNLIKFTSNNQLENLSDVIHLKKIS